MNAYIQGIQRILNARGCPAELCKHKIFKNENIGFKFCDAWSFRPDEGRRHRPNTPQHYVVVLFQNIAAATSVQYRDGAWISQSAGPYDGAAYLTGAYSITIYDPRPFWTWCRRRKTDLLLLRKDRIPKRYGEDESKRFEIHQTSAETHTGPHCWSFWWYSEPFQLRRI